MTKIAIQLIGTWIGLSIGNAIYMLLGFSTAHEIIERSYFQGMALLAFFLLMKINKS